MKVAWEVRSPAQMREKQRNKLTCGDTRLLPRPARTLSLRAAACRAGAPFYRLWGKGKGLVHKMFTATELIVHPGGCPCCFLG